MTRPIQTLPWMSIFTVVITGGAVLLAEPLHHAFSSNIVFNSVILVILIIGIAINFRQVLQLYLDIDWILRIDGHTDKRPIIKCPFKSNWELSSARAISMVQKMINNGIPANRIAATGFAEHHPADNADTPEAYARNRRIELKLTSR